MVLLLLAEMGSFSLDNVPNSGNTTQIQRRFLCDLFHLFQTYFTVFGPELRKLFVLCCKMMITGTHTVSRADVQIKNRCGPTEEETDDGGVRQKNESVK